MEMIKNSPKDCYQTVQKTVMVILERLQQVLQMESRISSQTERNQYNDLQSLLCATLQSVLKKVESEHAPLISDSIMQALLSMFQVSLVNLTKFYLWVHLLFISRLKLEFGVVLET